MVIRLDLCGDSQSISHALVDGAGQLASLRCAERGFELAVAGSVLRRRLASSPDGGEIEVSVGDVDPLPGQGEVVAAVVDSGPVVAGPFVEPAAHPDAVPDLGFGSTVVPPW